MAAMGLDRRLIIDNNSGKVTIKIASGFYIQR